MSTTLPSASSLTDEQLRVLAAEARGFTNIHLIHGDDWKGIKLGQYVRIPDPLDDANAALLLLGEHWAANVSHEEASVAIFRSWKTYIGEAPDFCRAIVLAFLRAEGKIL